MNKKLISNNGLSFVFKKINDIKEKNFYYLSMFENSEYQFLIF